MSSERDTRVRLDFHSDAAQFLQVAGDFLAADPVISTVVTTVADRAAGEVAAGVEQPAHDWWLSVHDAVGAVVGAGMRTSRGALRPPFLLPMPDEAALSLAQVLLRRGEEVWAVNGALPAAHVCAEELARITGHRVQVGQHTRLFELKELVRPSPVSGRLIAASEADLELTTAWFAAFFGDADEQAGRFRGESAQAAPDRGALLSRLRAGLVWFWTDEAGTPVHMTAANPPAYGVARIGPVYTPPEERRRGWASNAVAEVSRRLESDGTRVCLFTDQDNPTSNGIYTALGYRPVTDMANLLIAQGLTP